jgi:RNA polymerase sigma-70 factor (ECF subfamily)
MPRPHVELVAELSPDRPDGSGRASIAQVCREHARFIATVAYKLLGRDDELEDIVQDVLLSAVRGLGALRDPSATRAWLASVTVRTVRRRLRMRRVWQWCGLESAPEYESLAALGATPEENALLIRVYEILDGLPVDQRLAWCLRYIHGDKLELVAEACGCSLATAKRRIGAAHIALQRALADD